MVINRKFCAKCYNFISNFIFNCTVIFRVFRQTFTTKEQVKSNLINLFLTDTGERPMMPTFGIGIRKLLFEQNIDMEELNLEKILFMLELQHNIVTTHSRPVNLL